MPRRERFVVMKRRFVAGGVVSAEAVEDIHAVKKRKQPVILRVRFQHRHGDRRGHIGLFEIAAEIAHRHELHHAAAGTAVDARQRKNDAHGILHIIEAQPPESEIDVHRVFGRDHVEGVLTALQSADGSLYDLSGETVGVFPAGKSRPCADRTLDRSKAHEILFVNHRQ